MKAVDKNGKLFGKISILDIIIILGILALCAFAVIKIGVNKNHIFSDKKDYIATYKISDANDFIKDSLKVGDEIFDKATSTYVGKIEKIDVSPAVITSTTAIGSYAQFKSLKDFDITITCSHKCYEDSKEGLVVDKDYSLQNSAIKILSTKYTSFQAEILTISAAN